MEERWTFKCQNRAVITFRVSLNFYIFSDFIIITDRLNWPVHIKHITFIRGCKESSCILISFKQYSWKPNFTTAIHSIQIHRLERCPVEAACMSCQFFHCYGSSVPNMDPSIFRTRHKEVLVSIHSCTFIHSDTFWNELNVRNEVFVGAFDCWKLKLFQLNSGLLCFVFFFIRHFSNCRFTTRSDTVVNWTQIPNNNLTVDCTTNHYSWILRVEFNCCDFNRCLQDIVQSDNMRVFKV